MKLLNGSVLNILRPAFIPQLLGLLRLHDIQNGPLSAPLELVQLFLHIPLKVPIRFLGSHVD